MKNRRDERKKKKGNVRDEWGRIDEDDEAEGKWAIVNVGEWKKQEVRESGETKRGAEGETKGKK